jgi:hypothetical protein
MIRPIIFRYHSIMVLQFRQSVLAPMTAIPSTVPMIGIDYWIDSGVMP